MSTPLKQRTVTGSKKRGSTPGADLVDQGAEVLSQIQKETKAAATNEWDYKLALVIITVLAFATRFYLITHPNQVVFDEVHFGKVGKGFECVMALF